MAAPKRKPTAARFGKKKAFEKKHFNYGRWTKGRFSEAVTVTGPAKMVFLAGIGSEHEQTGKITYPGDFAAQCRYAFRKLKKVLARNGAGMADVVKQVTYDRRAPSETGRKMSPRRVWQGATASTHIPQRQPTRLA
jgi:enamine deaminase RidA (YjgF/YER057c/UK114 family)